MEIFSKKKLIIIDDVYPGKESPFRTEEYNNYIKKFKSVIILSNNLENDKMVINGNTFYKLPLSDDNLKNLQCEIKNKRRLAIATFINNICSDCYSNLDILEKCNIPFVFTIYPGGGLIFNDKIVNERLKKIFNSNLFKNVIVTQPIIYDYIMDNKLCDASKITKIYGIVTPKKALKNKIKKKHYKINKKVLDICFVAHKYCEDGKDKGYPIFINVAKKLCEQYENIYFHVVGEFTEKTLDITPIKNKIKFYGVQNTEWFNNFYLDKDIILSPNIPFVLSKGSFDGFPTGSATEAMLHKVVLIATDELRQNIFFKNLKNIIIVSSNEDEIINKIEYLYKNYNMIKKIGKCGRKVVKRNYSYKKQIRPRIKLINEYLKNKEKYE